MRRMKDKLVKICQMLMLSLVDGAVVLTSTEAKCPNSPNTQAAYLLTKRRPSFNIPPECQGPPQISLVSPINPPFIAT